MLILIQFRWHAADFSLILADRYDGGFDPSLICVKANGAQNDDYF